jgi:predicted cupin superfamily sugar epimerase
VARSGQPARYWIETLGLQPHPEGGYYRETYRSLETVAAAHLPARFGGARCFATAIYFLLEGGERSLLHRIKSDEVWHFYAGAALTLFMILPGGDAREVSLGPDPRRGDVLQATVPAGAWYGALVSDPRSYALVGGTVAPGFEFEDFELAEREALLARYPRHRALIERLTP